MTGPRVLCVSHPGIGHLAPMLPLARALADAGGDVRFAVAPGFREVPAASGFATFPAGLDWSEADAPAAFPELAGMSPWQRGMYLLREVFADQAAHATAHDVAAIIDGWQPELVLVTDYEYGGAVAAQATGTRWAKVAISLPIVAASMTRLVRDELAYLRSAFALDPWQPADPVGHVVPAPEQVVAAGPRLVRVRPPRTGGPEAIPQAPADRFVYVSLGTVFNDRIDVFAAVLAGLGELGIPVVATVGRDLDPAALGPQPPLVRVTQYLPQAQVLGRADLFVTHSPFYSAMTALGSGIPLLMVPLSADQPAHAAHFESLGVGTALRTPDLPADLLPQAPLLSPETVCAAAASLLVPGAARDRAAEVGQASGALPPVSTVVAALLDRAGVAL